MCPNSLKEKERLLAEKDRAVWTLESDIVGLQGRCTVIQHEFTRIRELEMVRERGGRGQGYTHSSSTSSPGSESWRW